VPYTITNPVMKEVPVTTTVQQEFPILHLTAVVWSMDALSQERHLKIAWVEGYLDGGTFVRGYEYEASFTEAEVAAKFSETSDELTVWDDQRKRYWELLAEHEPPYIPTGTFS
jgi:hypothetical protein